MSKVRAVVLVPPLLPWKIRSLLDTTDLITKSEEIFLNLPISTLSSLKRISAPLASKTISFSESSLIIPAEDIVILPDERAMVVPSMLKLSTSIPPSITAFWLSVTTPSEAIAIASASLTEPILPPSGIIILPLVSILPTTCNFSVGDAVPIPNLSEEFPLIKLLPVFVNLTALVEVLVLDPPTCKTFLDLIIPVWLTVTPSTTAAEDVAIARVVASVGTLYPLILTPILTVGPEVYCNCISTTPSCFILTA